MRARSREVLLSALSYSIPIVLFRSILFWDTFINKPLSYVRMECDPMTLGGENLAEIEQHFISLHQT